MNLNIAVFLGELQLDSQRKVLNGIISAAQKDGNNIFVFSITLTKDKLSNKGEEYIAMSEDLDLFDGFIIYAESVYDTEVRANLIRKIFDSNKPCASIDCMIEGMINISSNNAYSMRELSEHLINFHHVSKINYIGGPETSIDAITRKTVVIEQMKSNNIPIDDNRFFEGDFYARSGRKAIEYFEQNGLLDADVYICANDQMALGAYYALSERGINIPDDAFMTGYDYIFEAANHYPEITSVKRYEEKIGKAAYKNVIQCVTGNKFDYDVEILSEFICTESCGCNSRRPIPHRITVNNYANRVLQEARYAEMITDFSAEMTGATNYEDLCIILERYAHNLGGMDFISCFFDEENDGRNVRICLSYSDKKYSIEKNIPNDFLSKIVHSSEGGNYYIITSIHFSQKCFGYTIIKNSQMPLNSEFYRIFTLNLGNAIDHIRNYEQMQLMIKKLDQMWVFDPMTHIYNRAGFFKFADKMVEDARLEKRNLFLLFIDLDGLKKVNDDYGHEIGDQMICEMADILRKCRDKNELLMRYGGDEFVVLGEDFDAENVVEYIGRIRNYMDEKNAKADRPYTISASIGFHMIPYTDESPLSSLIDRADQEMYIEKREKHKRERLLEALGK